MVQWRQRGLLSKLHRMFARTPSACWIAILTKLRLAKLLQNTYGIAEPFYATVSKIELNILLPEFQVLCWAYFCNKTVLFTLLYVILQINSKSNQILAVAPGFGVAGKKLKYFPLNTHRLWRIKCGMKSEFYYQIQYLFFFYFGKVVQQVGMVRKTCDFNVLSCIRGNEGFLLIMK